MTSNGNDNPADPAYLALFKIRESLESFLKESSLRIKDLEQGTRLAEEVFKGSASNIIERENQVKDQKYEIEKLEQSINETKNSNDELDASIKEITKVTGRLNQTEEYQKETINKEKTRIEQLEETTEMMRGKISSLEQGVLDLKEELDSIRIQGDKSLADLRDTILALEEEIKQLKQENGVLDFLIMESSVEIPEVDVLTAVISSDTSISLDSLKKDMGIAPVAVSRTVQKLEAKGIITVSTVDSRISLSK